MGTSDAPEALDRSRAGRRILYRAVKQKVVLSLDKFVMDWIESTSVDSAERSGANSNMLVKHIKVLRNMK